MTQANQQQPSEQDNTSTGWVLERGSLCVGTRDGQFRWVTFTDPRALKFPTSEDANQYVFDYRGKFPVLIECRVQEHMWVDDVPLLRKLAAQSTDQKALIAELEITVSMFASVIKSGEPWSEECQARLDVLARAKESL